MYFYITCLFLQVFYGFFGGCVGRKGDFPLWSTWEGVGFFGGGDIKKGVKPMLVLIRMCVLRV